MKRLLTLLFLMAAWLSFAAEPVQHRSASEAYVDPDLNISFPANAGAFRKNEVSRSFNPMIGSKIRYSDPEGYCADVYIYSLPDSEQKISPQNFKKHFDEAKKAILNLPSKGLSLKTVTLSGEKIQQVGGCQVYSADFLLTWKDGSTQNSSMKMFAYKGKIIKLRVSCSPKDAEAFAAEIIKAFPKK